MKTLYFELNMGAAGDIINASLFELLKEEDKKKYLNKMNMIFPEKISVKAEKTEKCGIMGTHMCVLVNGIEEGHETDHHEMEHEADGHETDIHEHHETDHHHHHDHEHHTLEEIRKIINSVDVSEKVKKDAINIYMLIAEAESKVHGRKVDEIHFHEVGSLDAVCDVIGASLLLEMIAPDMIVASPVATGSGTVHCAHGILPVPAPATERLLIGIPTFAGDYSTELTTPTGAAIIKYFVKEYKKRPLMAVEKTGIGCGHKDLPEANIIRTVLGEENPLKSNDRVMELNINIDDMTPEDVSYGVKKIFENGALDVFTTNIMMKKGRTGILITVLLRESDEDKIVKTIFGYTTTIGIRKKICDRYIMKSEYQEVEYEGEKVRIKTSEGYGEQRVKPEYDDIERIAEKLEKPTFLIRQEITGRIK